VDIETVSTLLFVIREFCQHGKTISPDLREDLEVIARNFAIPENLRREASALLDQVVGA